MNKYIKFTFIFLGIWAIASLVNGLLSGIAIAVLDNNSLSYPVGTLALAVVFSFAFSAPMVGLVWFIGIMAQLAEKKGDALLQFILGTSFVCAIAGALLFIYAFRDEFPNARYVTGLCIIVSALMAVLFFRKQIKAIE